jgi:hypothetical protein
MMDTRRFWPFSIPIAAQEGEETSREVSFLEKMNQEGHKAYCSEGGVLGAVTANGREGEMIPRGGTDRGLRRYWEVILSNGSDVRDSFYVDGFENAAEAVLEWLRNKESSEIRSCIREYVVRKPGQRGW